LLRTSPAMTVNPRGLGLKAELEAYERAVAETREQPRALSSRRSRDSRPASSRQSMPVVKFDGRDVAAAIKAIKLATTTSGRALVNPPTNRPKRSIARRGVGSSAGF